MRSAAECGVFAKPLVRLRSFRGAWGCLARVASSFPVTGRFQLGPPAAVLRCATSLRLATRT
eukprot:4959543-Alexandrium_andersonii.AAC.1